MLSRADVCRIWQEKVKEHGWPSGTAAEVFVAALLKELDSSPAVPDRSKADQAVWNILARDLSSLVAKERAIKELRTIVAGYMGRLMKVKPEVVYARDLPRGPNGELPVVVPGCDHDWQIWPETDGQEQKCMKCGAYRRTP